MCVLGKKNRRLTLFTGVVTENNRIMANFAPRNSLIIKMIMKRRDYTKPTMKVVMLRHSGMLMVSNTRLSASRTNYEHGRTDGLNSTDEEVWGE